ncbi:hypothetical protein [Actinomadura monticuli]|uniref:Uncharacterized protein n=1 Tax=Actinomadura monticuli TaxID=3097367 RepID=A0ABV4QJR6_9ACTN
MPSSIPRTRPNNRRPHVKTTSLRALAVAAQLERNHAPEGPPGKVDGREESSPDLLAPTRPDLDPA